MMNFNTKLNNIIENNNSLLCIGLDSNIDKIPAHIKVLRYPQFEFNKIIIDSTHDLVCAYKPNSAFYEAQGEAGIHELKMTLDYINDNYPDIITILDAKRADIGNTNNGYVKYAFEYLNADSITLHPYLGEKSLEPFLEKKDKGIIILCKTSNQGSGEIQNLKINSKKIYQIVANNVATNWNKNNNCLLVIGATYPQELAEIRKISGDMTFLVPGIGAQGGDVAKTLQAGLNSEGKGLIISSSRSIIFASQGTDFGDIAKIEAMKLRDEINKYRKLI